MPYDLTDARVEVLALNAKIEECNEKLEYLAGVMMDKGLIPKPKEEGKNEKGK